MGVKDEKMLGKTIGLLRGQIFRLQRKRYADAEVRLTVEEAILLNMIDERSNQILQNIALVTGKNKSVVMRMVDSLESKGLITRSVNPSDRREKLLHLTDSGKTAVDKNRRTEGKLSDELLDGVSEEDLRVFLKVINSIGTNANRILTGE